jgi:anti-anti-sigma factor
MVDEQESIASLRVENETLRQRVAELELAMVKIQQGDEALRESEARFRRLADAAPVLIWMSGLDGLCYFFNHTWLTFTGRTMAQEQGNGWADGVHPDDLQRCMDIYLTSFGERRPFSMEYRLRRADGAYRWILDQGVPDWLPDGTFAGFIGSCIDITEHREAAALLRERLEQAELIEAQQEALRALGMPLIPLAEHVVAIPIVGAIDERRAQQVIETLLDGVAKNQAETAIIDITGVPVIDTLAANALVQVARAVGLLGARVILTGIRPEVAQTLIGLGVDMSAITTRGTLRAGIELALGLRRS